MRKSGYLQRQNSIVQANKDAAAETYMQFTGDMFALALNDPEVMGKDTLGEERLAKVNAAVQRYFRQFHPALSECAEADYYREKLDERLAKIYKTMFIPFRKRYDWIRELRTGRG